MNDRDRLIELFNEVEKNPEITCPKIKCKTCKYNISEYLCDVIARKVDYLIANGVFILPEDLRGTQDFSISAFIEAMQMYKEKDRYIKTPCKVGDVVYDVCTIFDESTLKPKTIIKPRIIDFVSQVGFIIESKGLVISKKEFGNTMFLTKEEAEERLKKINEMQNT